MGAARVGLVLGAGGVTGHGFHAGVLAGLHEATGWDPRTAAVIVGTSAGAEIAALLRAGVSAADLAARARGDGLSSDGERLLADVGPPLPVPPLRPAYVGRPAAPDALRAVARQPGSARTGTLLAAAVPAGRTPIEALAAHLRPLFGGGWPERPLWICVTDLDGRRRVVLGLDSVPETDVGTAVAASCAVPGWFTPVAIDGRRFVDGGAWSTTNLDLLADLDPPLDLVVVSAPLSRTVRRVRLTAEAVAVQRRGTPVVRIEPTIADLRAMGWNALDARRRGPAADQARATALRRFAR